LDQGALRGRDAWTALLAALALAVCGALAAEAPARPPAGPASNEPGYVIEGKTAVSRSTAHIEGTDDQPTFRRNRFGADFTYRFTLPPGKYALELGFCETYHKRAGRRVLDVFADGKKVVDGLDVFAEAGGKFKAIFKTAEVEVGADRQLEVRFRGREEKWKDPNAITSRIVLRGRGVEMVVRCGLESKPPGGAVVGFNLANLDEDERVGRLLDEAAALEREGKHSDALSRYDKVLTLYGEKMYGGHPGLYVPAADHALARLARLPAEGLELYRALYGDRARTLYERARASGDLAALLDVARTYFATDTGDDALYEAGRAQLALGRYEEAAALLERLAKHPVPSVPRAEVLARLACAYRKMGRERELASLVERSRKEFGGAEIALGGERKNLVEFLDGEVPRLAPLRAGTPAAGAWCAWEAEAGRAGRLAPIGRMPRLVWRFALPDGEKKAGEGAAHNLRHFPACSGGAVYVAGKKGVRSFWLLSGRERWRYTSFGDSSALLMAPCVRDGRVLAARPRFVPRGSGYKYIGERLVALDEATGRKLWGRDGRGPSGTHDFLLAPNLRSPGAPGGEALYAYTVVEEIKYWRRWSAHPSLRALDPATGRVRWERRLASVLPRHRIWGVLVPDAPVALSGGVAYVQTNAGVVAALDVRAGRVRWIRKYTQDPFANRPDRPTPWDERWALNAPVVAQGMVAVAPCDGEELLVLRADTGRLAWTRERGAAKQLLGVEGDALLLVTGERVLALDLFTGEELWAKGLPAPPFGRGAIAPGGEAGGGAVYVPTRKGIWRARCADGKELPFLAVEDASHAGNLAVVETRAGLVVVTCSDTHLNVFYDPPAALAALAKRAAGDADASERACAIMDEAEVLSAPGAVETTEAKREEKIGALCRAALAAPEEARLAGERVRALAASRLASLWRARAERAGTAGRSADALKIWETAVANARAGSAEWVAAVRGRVGALEATGCLPEAVAAYQEILERAPDLPVEVEPGFLKAAGEHAFERIRAIRKRPGRDPYAAFESKAKALLAKDSPDALARLAGRFPNARGAPEALARLAGLAGNDRPARLRWLTLLAGRYPEAAEAKAARAELAPGNAPLARFCEWGLKNEAWRVPDEPKTKIALKPPLEVLWRVKAPTEDTEQVVFPVTAAGEDGPLVFIGQRHPSSPDAAVLECRRARDGSLAWRHEVRTTGAGPGGPGEKGGSGGGAGGLSGAVLAGGRLVACLGPELYGFDPRDRGRSWHFAAPEAIGNLRAAGEVVSFTAGGHLFAVDARTGRELWRRPVRGIVYAGPVVSRGRVSVVTRYPDLIETYDLASGDFVLRRSLGRVYQQYRGGKPVYANEGATGLLVRSKEGAYALESYDLATGERRGRAPAWETGLGGGGGKWMFLLGGAGGRHPVWRLSVFDLETGKQAWEKTQGGGWAAAADGVVYLGSGGTTAFDAATGKELWRGGGASSAATCLVGPKHLVLNSAARAGDRVASRLVVVRRTDGKDVGSFELATRKLGYPRGYKGTTIWLAGGVVVACTSPEIVGIGRKAP